MASNFPRTRGGRPPQMSRKDELLARKAELQAQQAQQAQQAAPVSRKDELLARKAELQSQIPKEKESGFEDFGEGLAVSVLEPYYGIKDLFGQHDEEGAARLKDWQDDAGESGWGTAGQVVGEMAQFAVPGGVALKGLKGAGLAKGLLGAGTVAATEGGIGAGLGALRMPDEGETRLGNAAAEGAAGALGSGIATGIGAGIRGLTKTRAAQKLMDEGVELTPGQAAESKFVQGLESVMDITPILARGTKDARKVAKEQWNKKILQEAAPEGTQITELGTAGAKQMKDAVEEAYAEAWDGVGAVTSAASKPMYSTMAEAAKRLGKADGRVLRNVWNDVQKAVRTKDPKAFKTLDENLRRQINSAEPEKYELLTALKAARARLRESVPTANQTALKVIDDKYPSFLTARDAVKNSLDDAGVFTPSRLNKSIKKVGKNLAATGEAALQKSAAEGMETVGRKEGPQPLEWLRRLSGMFTGPPKSVMDAGGRAMFGQTAPQRFARHVGSAPMSRAIRKVATGGNIGQALVND